MRRVLVAGPLLLPCLLLVICCADRNPVGPTSSAALDQFVQALRQQGHTVSVAGQISPNANGFFSVPAQQGTSKRGAGECVRLCERAGRGHGGRLDLRGRPTESDEARHLGEYAAFLP